MGDFKPVFHCEILLLVVLLFWFCRGALGDEEKVVTVDVNAARDLLKKGFIYLDVRTEEEFRKGHMENALNIPYLLNTPQGMVKNAKFMDQVLSNCSKEDHLLVGCRSGVRSLNAAADLLNAEFRHVYNMGGGYIGWTKNGFPVKKPHNINEEL